MIRPSSDMAPAGRVPSPIITTWLENFDAPVTPTVADAPIEAPLRRPELERARQQAWNEGFLAGCRSAHHSAERTDAHSTVTMLDQLDTLEQSMVAVAEVNAILVARWLGEA